MEPKDSTDVGLNMPTRINIYKAGLRRSPRLKENTANNGIKQKSHVTFGATVLKTVYLFTFLCNVKDSLPSMPYYPIKPNASLTARAMHRFRELNKLYDGTVNQLHHFDFSIINISSNEVFTYHKSMKKADAELFIAAM